MKRVLVISFLSCIFLYTSANSKENITSPVYDTLRTDAICPIIYPDTTGNETLRAFRKAFQLREMVKNQEGDLQKAIELLHWTSNRWQHNGGHSAGTSDAFEILSRAAAGEGFSCAEYAVVLATAANAIGIPARVVNLKIREAETAVSGAGHSLTEVYIRELKRWVMMDPQSDLVAFSEGQPLSAMELRKAIDTAPTEIEVLFKGEWGSENLLKQVINWYSPYLYFFDTAFDNRYGISKKRSCSGDTRLFLVPLGEKAPEIFQGHHPLTGFSTTHSVADFYQEPVFEP
ncbi:MAG: transglutaminase-like domain-containing protein [Bacteroidales bacterium]